MTSEFYCQQRLSYDGSPCTVRYIGQVEGTKGVWLGVEWDDPSRGKHSGDHEGVKYFNCISPHPNTGSFVRPARPHDKPLNFLEALRKKYAPDTASAKSSTNNFHDQDVSAQPIEIGGKVVEEVGFEKIGRQLATLTDLRVVLLDGLCVANLLDPIRGGNYQEWHQILEEIGQACPKITELDLSRNLLEQWQDVEGLCCALQALKVLKVNGNRFRNMTCHEATLIHSFARIKELGLDDTMLTWAEINSVASRFPSLASLSLASNNLTVVGTHKFSANLTMLNLERNSLTSIKALYGLASSPNLQQLQLGYNSIATVYDGATSKDGLRITKSHFPRSISHIDLSNNAIRSWDFLDDVQDVFPGLTALRLAHNPLFDALSTEKKGPLTSDEGYMLTIAKLGNLKSLNFSNVSPRERANAEMYYLSCIAKELAAVSEDKEGAILVRHRRYDELCKLHGTPTIARVNSNVINPKTLEARLIHFKFYLPASFAKDTVSTGVAHEKQIPRGFDVYRLKGIVGKLFNHSPLRLRLIWETGEWDPVAATQLEDWNSSDEEVAVDRCDARSNWAKREVELRNGTRELGFWIEGREAIIRVELR